MGKMPDRLGTPATDRCGIVCKCVQEQNDYFYLSDCHRYRQCRRISHFTFYNDFNGIGRTHAHTHTSKVWKVRLFVLLICVSARVRACTRVKRSFISLLSQPTRWNFILYYLRKKWINRTIMAKQWTSCYFYSHRFPHFWNHIYRKTANEQQNHVKKIVLLCCFTRLTIARVIIIIAVPRCCVFYMLAVLLVALSFFEFVPHPFFIMRYAMSFMLCVVLFSTLEFRFHTLFGPVLHTTLNNCDKYNTSRWEFRCCCCCCGFFSSYYVLHYLIMKFTVIQRQSAASLVWIICNLFSWKIYLSQKRK